jgi:hypothetical protein
MNRLRLFWRGLLGCLFFGVILWNPLHVHGSSYSLQSVVSLTATPSPTPPVPTPTPTVISPTLQSLFFPVVANNIGLSPIELNQVWIADSKGGRQDAFLANSELRFYSLGYSRVVTDSIHLTWDQAGPCGPSQVFSGTVEVNPGVWQKYLSSTAPDCLGVYTNTLQFTYQNYSQTLTADFVVNPPSQVIRGNFQGFDRCNVPSIPDMQTWWKDSPYYTINLYIGGSLSHCGNLELDSLWVQQTAKQGWTFIPTWVGPQAPCTTFLDRISYDPQVAYLQGQAEARSAVEASSRIGFLGGSIIYYDVESYAVAWNNSSCRNAMNSFLQGWTQSLHSMGYRAGSYGASCNSFITEWASISPTLDDIWIASWHLPPQYDPNATVWGASCLSDTLWANHQRIKQYAGDHIETWGGVSMPIDSDVIDGEVSLLPITSTQMANPPAMMAPNTILSLEGSQIKEMQALSNGVAWFLNGDHLVWRDASNSTWGRSTLPVKGDQTILDVTFRDGTQGWLAAQDPTTGDISIYATIDSKDRWEKVSSIISSSLASKGSLSFIDDKSGWLALRLQSSSNFSLGELFHTDDGGRTWTELPLPVAGSVLFRTSLSGLLVGGVSGDELFATEDGGKSWAKLPSNDQRYLSGINGPGAILLNLAAANFENLSGAVLEAQFSDSTTGWAIVQQSACSGEKYPAQSEKNAATNPLQCTIQQLIFETRDGGRIWTQLPL